MALAWLAESDSAPGAYEFIADLGTNEFFDYEIGHSTDGKTLDSVDHRSRLARRPEAGNRLSTRFKFRVAAPLFSRQSRDLQLRSFRDEKRNGPALSRILTVIPGLDAGDEYEPAGDGGAGSEPMSMGMFRRAFNPCRSVAFAFAESTTPEAGAGAMAERFRLMFEEGPTVDISGRPRTAYLASAGAVFSLRIAASGPQPSSTLPRAILELSLIDPQARQRVAAKTFRLTELAVGQPIRAAFSPEELRSVPANRPLRAYAALRWPRAGGRGVPGAQGRQEFYLADRRIFKSADVDRSTEIPLADPVRYRAFWNLIWERSHGASRWKLDVACRYYLRAAAEHDSNARLETRMLLESGDPDSAVEQVAGRMKSGLELSFEELNKLLPLVSNEQPLGDEDLRALKSSEFKDRLDLQASARLQASGDRSAEGIVWVFPEITLADVAFHEVLEADGDGRVTRTQERHVRFPVPSAIHFVTARSAQMAETTPADEGRLRLDGYEILSDSKVSTMPVMLVSSGQTRAR